MYYQKVMQLLSRLFVVFSCLLTVCQTQTYIYPGQKKSAHSYSRPSTSAASYYNSASSPSFADSYYKHLAQRNSYPYSSTAGLYSSYRQPAVTKATSSPYRKSPTSKVFYRNSNPSYSSSFNKQYSSSSFNTDNFKKDSSVSKLSSTNSKRVSRADAENSKFVGAENQENDDGARTVFLKRKKNRRRFGGAQINPCSPYGRDTGKNITPPPKVQGRFLWDVNVYNVYPQNPVGLGCGYYGGFGTGLGGGLRPGLLSDPISPEYYPPGAGIANFLSLFAPGILQNSLAVTARPQLFADYGLSSTDNDLQNDPEVDPNYRPTPSAVPVRRPNRVSYDSAGAPAITPGQIVGGISTSVNNIIQQITGNAQPVYG